MSSSFDVYISITHEQLDVEAKISELVTVTNNAAHFFFLYSAWKGKIEGLKL